MKVNETVVNFAVYEDAVEFYGMAEVTLPEIKTKSNTISGAGIAGDFNSGTMGHSEAMSLSLNFRTLQTEMFKLNEPRNHQIDLRAVQQVRDTVSGKIEMQSVKHVMTIFPAGLNPGKVAPATPADASGEHNVTYWATYIDGVKVLEIDILNFIYFVNGVDYLKDVRKGLGK